MQKIMAWVFLIVTNFFFLVICSYAQERVSISSSGEHANERSELPSISADGRIVVYTSRASNLVQGDDNSRWDIYAYNRDTGSAEIISKSTQGQIGNSSSRRASVSGDGRIVVFQSSADNLVTGDSNGTLDVFTHDRLTGVTERVSISSSGQQGNDISFSSTISADGKRVAYTSRADNLVSGDSNSVDDVFVYDRTTKITQRVSVSSSAEQARGRSTYPHLSADGQIITFTSSANNLVINDTNQKYDVFVRDLRTGKTERVSVSYSGAQGNLHSGPSQISADGRIVAFDSYATNIAGQDSKYILGVFVHDLETGQTERVSVSSSGMKASRSSKLGGISADGAMVLFSSSAQNLYESNPNGYPNIFIHHRISRSTDRIVEPASSFNRAVTSPVISEDGNEIAFIAAHEGLLYPYTVLRGDVFVTENRFKHQQVKLTGKPGIFPTTDSGIFIWRELNGATHVKAVAGDPAQGGLLTQFSGSIEAGQLISSLLPLNLEASSVPADELSQVSSKQVSFNLFVTSPYDDEFSFVADPDEPLCIDLSNYSGGMFLGPNRFEVTPPYDLHGLYNDTNSAVCNNNSETQTIGKPDINRSMDQGIFAWKNSAGVWQVEVVSGDTARWVDVDVSSDQALSNVRAVNLESNDIFTVSTTMINARLKVFAPWMDGFRFKVQDQSNSCLSTIAVDMPIYIGPNRVNKASNVDLVSLQSCQ